jgi:hypothetical protein
VPVATLHHDRRSERSFLFTMSDITHPQETSRLPVDAKDVLADEQKAPPGGARRDRTDDLLLAKQALSQLSYGPSGEQ